MTEMVTPEVVVVAPPEQKKEEVVPEIIKFRDFRGQASAEDFHFTVPNTEIDELISNNDPHFKEYRYKVGSGHIRVPYVHEAARKILSKYYAIGASHNFTIQEFLMMVRGY